MSGCAWGIEESQISELNKRSSILIIDDERDISRLYKIIFENIGYNVVLADNGKMAWQILQTGYFMFDIIISDNRMGVMSGLDFVKNLRRFNKAVPIIIFTGTTGDISQENRRSLGINMVLGKPVENDEIVRSVGELLFLVQLSN